MKFVHTVMNHKSKAKFDFKLHHYFRFGVMPLFTLGGYGGICVQWTHSAILSHCLMNCKMGSNLLKLKNLFAGITERINEGER